MIYANQVGGIIERRHVWSALVQILRDHADRVVDQAHVPEQNGVWERRCSSHGISECASEGLEMGELAHVSCRLLNQCSFSLAEFSVVLGRAFGDLVVPKHACVLTKLMQQTSHPGLAEEASGDHRPPAHPPLCFTPSPHPHIMMQRARVHVQHSCLQSSYGDEIRPSANVLRNSRVGGSAGLMYGIERALAEDDFRMLHTKQMQA